MFKKVSLLFGLIFLVCSVFLLVGCGNLTDAIIENVVGKLIDAENEAIEAGRDDTAQGNDDLEPVEAVEEEFVAEDEDFSIKMDSSSNMEWPSDIPSHVPQLQGDINFIVEASEDGVVNYQIYFENVPETDMDEYIRTLESASDWQVVTRMNYGDEGWMIQAMMDVDDNFWMLVVACMGDGDGSMQVTFTP